MQGVNVDIEDIIKDDPVRKTAFHKTNNYLAKSDKEAFKPFCTWLMKKGLCPHSSQTQEKKEESESDQHENKKDKGKTDNDWVITMKKCTLERNYGMRTLDNTFHTDPISYTQKKEKYAQYYTNFGTKKKPPTTTSQSSSSSRR
jgi:hypothetical protein